MLWLRTVASSTASDSCLWSDPFWLGFFLFSSFISPCFICFLSYLLLSLSFPEVWESCWEDERLITNSGTEIVTQYYDQDFLVSSTASDLSLLSNQLTVCLFLFLALFFFVSSVFSFLPPTIPFFFSSMRAVDERLTKISHKWPEGAMGMIYSLFHFPYSLCWLLWHWNEDTKFRGNEKLRYTTQWKIWYRYFK